VGPGSPLGRTVVLNGGLSLLKAEMRNPNVTVTVVVAGAELGHPVGPGSARGGPPGSSAPELGRMSSIGSMPLSDTHTSFTVMLEIHRLWFYYVFMFLGPIFLTVILSWATLCVTPTTWSCASQPP